jgi:hypothetical protein
LTYEDNPDRSPHQYINYSNDYNYCNSRKRQFADIWNATMIYGSLRREALQERRLVIGRAGQGER